MPRTVTLSLELLQTFVALIRSGGDAALAMRGLGINQPTMSKRLRHVQHAGPLLERPWVVRHGKNWELTEEGRRVWPAVTEIVDRYENLERFLDGETSPGPATVRFACGQQMVVGPVREAAKQFRQEHPGVALRISTVRGRTRIEGVSNGSLDLAVVTHDEPAIHEIARRPLNVERLASHRLILICAADSPWSRSARALPKSGVGAEALARFPLILPEPDSGIRKSLDGVLYRQGVLHQLTIAMEIGGWAAIMAYVRDGFGVGLVSEPVLKDGEGLAMRPLDTSVFPPIESRLICRRIVGSGDALDLSEPAQKWRALLHESAAGRGGPRT